MREPKRAGTNNIIIRGCFIASAVLFLLLGSCSEGSETPAVINTPEASEMPTISAAKTPTATPKPTPVATTAPEATDTAAASAAPTASDALKDEPHTFIGKAMCTAKEYVNIRKEASKSAAVKGTLPSGKTADVIKYSGDWAHIVYKGTEGYVSRSYLIKIYKPEVDVPMGDWASIVINQTNLLPENFSVGLAEFKNGKVDERIRKVCERMFADAKKDGVSLKLVDAYRSFETQKSEFEKKVKDYLDDGYGREEAEKKASRITARPNTSEHQTGLALDIVTPSHTKRNEGFAKTKAFKWLNENAHNYGFTLRYKKGRESLTKVMYEPWHWRFVGVKAAVDMKLSTECLEEYFGTD